MDRGRLIEGQTYQNHRGDFRGPMSFVLQAHSAGWFVDQYGIQYYDNGLQVNHIPHSTGNIDLKTAGTTEGWRP